MDHPHNNGRFCTLLGAFPHPICYDYSSQLQHGRSDAVVLCDVRQHFLLSGVRNKFSNLHFSVRKIQEGVEETDFCLPREDCVL